MPSMNWCAKITDGMDIQHGDGSSKNLISYEETNVEASVPAKHNKSESSLSLESSVESDNGDKYDHPNPFRDSKETSNEPQEPAILPEVSGQNPIMGLQESSSLSPQPAVLSGGYDPNRIPASVFNSKPTTPMEWSVASNESLFSIHVGNTSFSRDHVFMLFKSGELAKLDEMFNIPPTLHLANESEKIDIKNNDIGKESEVTDAKSMEISKLEPASSATAPKAVMFDSPKKTNNEGMFPAEEVRNSTSSAHSFQFPIFDTDYGRESPLKAGTPKQYSHKKLQLEAHPHKPGAATRPSWLSCFTCCSPGC